LALAGGLSPEAVDEYLHYIPFPKNMGTTADLQEQFEGLREELPGALVVLDSLRSYMARFKLDPEKNVQVEEFFGPVMAAVKSGPMEGRITVEVIDHSNRATRGTDDYVASGAAAKAQAVDAVYYWEKMRWFSQDVQGVVKLAVKDDRRGRLDHERYYKIGGQGPGRPLFFQRTDAAAVGTDGRILEDVRQWMSDHPGAPQTKTAVRAGVKGDNGKIDAALVTLDAMEAEPIYAHSEGKRAPVYVWDEDADPATGLEV